MLFLFKFLQTEQSKDINFLRREEDEALGKSLSIILEEDSIDHEAKNDCTTSDHTFISTGEELQEHFAVQKVLSKDTIKQINATVLDLDAELKKIETM